MAAVKKLFCRNMIKTMSIEKNFFFLAEMSLKVLEVYLTQAGTRVAE